LERVDERENAESSSTVRVLDVDLRCSSSASRAERSMRTLKAIFRNALKNELSLQIARDDENRILIRKSRSEIEVNVRESKFICETLALFVREIERENSGA